MNRLDFGDKYPSDIGDQLPRNPTEGMEETDYFFKSEFPVKVPNFPAQIFNEQPPSVSAAGRIKHAFYGWVQPGDEYGSEDYHPQTRKPMEIDGLYYIDVITEDGYTVRAQVIPFQENETFSDLDPVIVIRGVVEDNFYALLPKNRESVRTFFLKDDLQLTNDSADAYLEGEYPVEDGEVFTVWNTGNRFSGWGHGNLPEFPDKFEVNNTLLCSYTATQPLYIIYNAAAEEWESWGSDVSSGIRWAKIESSIGALQGNQNHSVTVKACEYDGTGVTGDAFTVKTHLKPRAYLDLAIGDVVGYLVDENIIITDIWGYLGGVDVHGADCSSQTVQIEPAIQLTFDLDDFCVTEDAGVATIKLRTDEGPTEGPTDGPSEEPGECIRVVTDVYCRPIGSGDNPTATPTPTADPDAGTEIVCEYAWIRILERCDPTPSPSPTPGPIPTIGPTPSPHPSKGPLEGSWGIAVWGGNKKWNIIELLPQLIIVAKATVYGISDSTPSNVSWSDSTFFVDNVEKLQPAGLTWDFNE